MAKGEQTVVIATVIRNIDINERTLLIIVLSKSLIHIRNKPYVMH